MQPVALNENIFVCYSLEDFYKTKQNKTEHENINIINRTRKKNQNKNKIITKFSSRGLHNHFRIRNEHFEKKLVVLEGMYVRLDYFVVEADHLVLQDHVGFPEVHQHEQYFVTCYFFVSPR